MAKISRVNDIGEGLCYAGHVDVPLGSPKAYIVTHITGADTVFVDGEPMAIVGTIGETDCGHTTTAITGSDTVFAENMPIHRVDDIGAINEGDGDHVVITGSEKVGN